MTTFFCAICRYEFDRSGRCAYHPEEPLQPLPLRRWGRPVSLGANRRRAGVVPAQEAVRAYSVEGWLGPWKKVLGQLPRSPSSTLLSGAPGEGKTTLALCLAARVAQAGHRALVVAAENHGGGPALSSILERADAIRDGVLVSDARTPREVDSDVEQHKPLLLLIDSWQVLGSAGPDIEEWQAAGARHVIAISHVNTRGQAFGGFQLSHLVDVHLSVENMAARVEKCRFGIPSGATLSWQEARIGPEGEHQDESEANRKVIPLRAGGVS